jgi:hypothetical protein
MAAPSSTDHSGLRDATRKPDETTIRAFSSEVDTGSRQENASKQKARASVLLEAEPKRP